MRASPQALVLRRYQRLGFMRVVHLGRSTCHARSGREDQFRVSSLLVASSSGLQDQDPPVRKGRVRARGSPRASALLRVCRLGFSLWVFDRFPFGFGVGCRGFTVWGLGLGFRVHAKNRKIAGIESNTCVTIIVARTEYICSFPRVTIGRYRGTSLIRNSIPPLGPPEGPRHSPTVGS